MVRDVVDEVTPSEVHAQQDAACSIARSLEVIGDRWTILILRDAFRGIRRFDEIRRDLDIARPVLADRLRKLVDHGVLQKVEYQAHPPRYEYRLTPMGIELSPALVALMHWGDKHLSDGGAPTVLVHEPCGHSLEQGFWCPTCRQTFSPTDIASRPGPGRRGGRTDPHSHTPTPGGTRAHTP